MENSFCSAGPFGCLVSTELIILFCEGLFVCLFVFVFGEGGGWVGDAYVLIIGTSFLHFLLFCI